MTDSELLIFAADRLSKHWGDGECDFVQKLRDMATIARAELNTIYVIPCPLCNHRPSCGQYRTICEVYKEYDGEGCVLRVGHTGFHKSRKVVEEKIDGDIISSYEDTVDKVLRDGS